MDASHTIRPEWMFAFTASCQHFVGGWLDVWPKSVSRTVAAFVRELPRPESAAERAILRSRMGLFASQAEDCHHRLFHRFPAVPACTATFVTHRSFEWNDVRRDPLEVFTTWGHQYEAEFEASHQWPLAIRAAVLVEQRWSRPLELSEICRELACSRSALTHPVSEVLTVSLREYHLKVRFRHAFMMLSEPGSKVHAVAIVCGYSTAEAFTRAFHAVTGLTPSDVRALRRQDAAALLDERLAIGARVRRVSDSRTGPGGVVTPKIA